MSLYQGRALRPERGAPRGPLASVPRPGRILVRMLILLAVVAIGVHLPWAALRKRVAVKLLPKPQCARVIMASFDDVEKAGNAVAAVIAAGIIPAGLEMMDKPATRAVVLASRRSL